MNRDELSAALRDVGATLGLNFRPYTATARAPFESYLSVMARTGVLVARHGPLLANAMFLPPGVSLSWLFCSAPVSMHAQLGVVLFAAGQGPMPRCPFQSALHAAR